jgi:putative transposase
MKRKRLTVEQIISILKKAKAGVTVKELARQYGIGEATYYCWKAKFGGLNVNQSKRLKHLQQENRKLKTMLADPIYRNRGSLQL